MGAALSIAGLLAAAGSIATATPFDLAGRSVVLTAHAAGAQIYACAMTGAGTPAWTFREPIATLIQDGKTIGRHYAGPSWALDDGSLITGKVAETQPGQTLADIPQLKLNVVANAGRGLLGQVSTVYRVQTHGGKLAGACQTPGALIAVPYEADYVFVR